VFQNVQQSEAYAQVNLVGYGLLIFGQNIKNRQCTECVVDLDQERWMIFFELLMATFEVISIFEAPGAKMKNGLSLKPTL